MPRSNYSTRVLFGFIPFAIAIVLVMGCMYVALQQVYRMTGNDPQIQLAEDAAMRLSRGTALETVVPAQTVTIETSLLPYLIVYDKNGKPLSGSGSLHGSAPVLPRGVLDAVKETGENRLTWQPERGIRQALVIIPFHTDKGDGYVMSGRSLRLTEERIQTLGIITIIALAVTLLSTFFTILLKERFVH